MKSKTKSSRKGGFSMFKSPLLTTNTIYKTKIQNQGIVEGVELYFIRHAHSCANMIEAYGAKGLQKLSSKNIRPDYAPNPHITNFGISHALGSTLGEFSYSSKIQPDLVCASQLIRTWETAYTLFYHYFNEKTQNGKCKNPLYICPYIGENRDVKLPGAPYLDLDNQPEDIKTSKNKFNRFIKHFKEYIQTYYPNTINVDDLCTPNIDYLTPDGKIMVNKAQRVLTNERNRNYITDEPDFNEFIRVILPTLIQKVKQDRILKGPMRGENKPIRIVIVTHSKFMEENILKQLSSNDKQTILRYRDSEGKVKVYNCDVYKMSLVADRNTRKTNIFFPENSQVATQIDFYQMPSPSGGFTDKNFSISNKNVSPQYFNQYFEKLYPSRNIEQLNKMFDIIVGLCDKETKRNGNKEYNYRNLLMDKLVGVWAKGKGYSSANSIQELKNSLSGLLLSSQTRRNNRNLGMNGPPNVNESERPTEVLVKPPYTPYQYSNNENERNTEIYVKSPYTPYQNPNNENRNSGHSVNKSNKSLTYSSPQSAAPLGQRASFITPVQLRVTPPINNVIRKASSVRVEPSPIEVIDGGKKKKRTVKKKSVQRKSSSSFRKK